MAKWDLYCPRGLFIKDGKFDTTQIDDGLAVGLNPQPIISGYNPELIDAFVGWMHLRRNKGLDLKLTAHARSDLLHEADAKKELDAIVEINKKYDSSNPIIREVVYHAGSVISSEEELVMRKKAGYNLDEISLSELILREKKGLLKGEAPFYAKNFLNKLNIARDTYDSLRRYGLEQEIDVLVENMPVIEFEICDGGPKNKPEELKKDVRWASTAWMSGQVQIGLLGSSQDLIHILGMNGKLCIDIEHLDQTAEYFASNYQRSEDFGASFPIEGGAPFADLIFFYDNLPNEVKFVERNFDMIISLYEPSYGPIQHVRRPSPKESLSVNTSKEYPFYDSIFIPDEYPAFNSYNFINWIGKDRIKIAHLGGQVSMFYEDEGIKKIGSHMPITFPGDPNEFIVDDKMREKQNALRKEKITKYLTALHEAGCRKGVIEVHIGVYGGEKWRQYMEISKKNIESVLAKID